MQLSIFASMSIVLLGGLLTSFALFCHSDQGMRFVPSVAFIEINAHGFEVIAVRF